MFFGPSTASCPLVSEYKALVFLVEKFTASPLKLEKLTVFTDSQELVEAVNYIKFSLKIPWFVERSFVVLIQQSNIDLIKVSRDFIHTADSLAREGRLRDKIIYAWC